MDQTGPDAPEVEYAYKPSVLGSIWNFRLAPDALVWGIGNVSGRVPYRNIRRIRLAFRPVTMQSYRFLAEIWAEKTPKLPVASASWKSLVEQERLDVPYSRFVTALHEKIAAAQGEPRLNAGAAPLLYWPGVAVFVGLCIATCWLIFHALQQGETAATLFLLGFFIYVAWQLGRFFKRNLPRSYSLHSIPNDVLPTRPN